MHFAMHGLTWVHRCSSTTSVYSIISWPKQMKKTLAYVGTKLSGLLDGFSSFILELPVYPRNGLIKHLNFIGVLVYSIGICVLIGSSLRLKCTSIKNQDWFGLLIGFYTNNSFLDLRYGVFYVQFTCPYALKIRAPLLNILFRMHRL